ncbi:hypothetical protein J6S37_01835, partial [Candidatus Saccharibacteria bacterium]|nr:hypothetical protein [Candidatus Saccharibacteria bacterium]
EKDRDRGEDALAEYEKVRPGVVKDLEKARVMAEAGDADRTEAAKNRGVIYDDNGESRPLSEKFEEAADQAEEEAGMKYDEEKERIKHKEALAEYEKERPDAVKDPREAWYIAHKTNFSRTQAALHRGNHQRYHINGETTDNISRYYEAQADKEEIEAAREYAEKMAEIDRGRVKDPEKARVMAVAADPFHTEAIKAKQEARDALEIGDDASIKKAESKMEEARKAEASAKQATQEAERRYDQIEELKSKIDDIKIGG